MLAAEEAPDSAASSGPEDISDEARHVSQRPRNPNQDVWEPTAEMLADYEAHMAGTALFHTCIHGKAGFKASCDTSMPFWSQY